MVSCLVAQRTNQWKANAVKEAEKVWEKKEEAESLNLALQAEVEALTADKTALVQAKATAGPLA